MNDLPVLGFEGQFLPSRQGLGHGFAPVRQVDEKTVLVQRDLAPFDDQAHNQLLTRG